MTREELALYGKYGILSRAYHFDAYICAQCGFSELYFRRKNLWA